MERPPYFDWRLDRWKIGLALVLLLGLVVLAPGSSPAPGPQGASPLTRPGQRPVVGSSSAQPLAGTPRPDPAPTAVSAAEEQAALSQLSPDVPAALPLTIAIFEPGQLPLRNSTPLFTGQAAPNGQVELSVAGRRYGVLADERGYWQFAPSRPLPVGMTWVRARGVDERGTGLTRWVSVMALISFGAEPVPPPAILAPLPGIGASGMGPMAGADLQLSGEGQAGSRLVIHARSGSTAEDGPVGQLSVGGDGVWTWRMEKPPSAPVTLWAVVVDDNDVPLSRSWPVTIETAPEARAGTDAQPTVAPSDPTR